MKKTTQNKLIKIVKGAIGWIIVILLLILFFIFLKNSNTFYTSFVEPYQDYWNLLWILIPSIAIISTLYKYRNRGKKFKGISSILDGVIGGLVATYLLELRASNWVLQISGFLLTIIVIILRIWYTKDE